MHQQLEPGALPVSRPCAVTWLGLFLLGSGILLVSEVFSREAIVFDLAGISNVILLLAYLCGTPPGDRTARIGDEIHRCL